MCIRDSDMGNSPSENAPEGPSRTDDGMLVLSYLLSGIIFLSLIHISEPTRPY